jgi:hypothetical protein
VYVAKFKRLGGSPGFLVTLMVLDFGRVIYLTWPLRHRGESRVCTRGTGDSDSESEDNSERVCPVWPCLDCEQAPFPSAAPASSPIVSDSDDQRELTNKPNLSGPGGDPASPWYYSSALFPLSPSQRKAHWQPQARSRKPTYEAATKSRPSPGHTVTTQATRTWLGAADSRESGARPASPGGSRQATPGGMVRSPSAVARRDATDTRPQSSIIMVGIRG